MNAIGPIVLAAILLLLGPLGCSSPPGSKAGAAATVEVLYQPRHARGFAIERRDGLKYLRVINPWKFAVGIEFSYPLLSDADSLPAPGIRVPVRRAVCMSTSHLAFLDVLGRTDAVVGMSGPGLVYSPGLRGRFEERGVADVGYDSNLSFELICSLRPDVVFAYGVQGEFTASEEKLRELGVPVVYVGDYMESTPLGRAEWLVAMAAFFGLEELASTTFDSVGREYERIRCLAEAVADRPAVMLNAPFKDVWYLPGGKGYMARFVADAGGTCLLADSLGRESVPAGIEQAYSLALSADYWLTADLSRSLSDLGRADGRLTAIPAFKSGRVFNNNARLNLFGGNDIWQSGVVRPDLVLADLIAILHPGLLPGRELVYYKQLK